MWLKGSTTITAFQSTIYGLLTGAAAAGTAGGGQAGNGAQVVGTDAWTGLDPTNFVIRSQKTETPFATEYALYRGAPRFCARTTSTVFAATIPTQIGKPTFTGAHTGVVARVYYAIFVSTANTSPGNLSGTVLSYIIVNADTGATVTSGTTSGWSGSTDTKLIAQGVSVTLTLGGADQFVGGSNAVLWVRGYTTTFTQGIDFFPEAAKVSGSVTVSNSSGGSNNYSGAGVDYTLVGQLWAHPVAGDASSIAFNSAQTDWGGNGAGTGIAWNAAGSPPAVGANYFIPATYAVYGAYYQVPNVVSIGGNFSLTGAPMDAWDATLQVGRFVMQSTTATTGPKVTVNTTQQMARLFTGASQAGGTFINYWISVKQDKIVMVFRGDPGQTGLTVMMTLQRYTPLVSTDKQPWGFFSTAADASTIGFAALHVSSKYVYEQKYMGTPAQSFTSQQLVQAMWQMSLSGNAAETILAGIGTTLPVQNPNNWDLRWWLYSLYATYGKGGSNLVGTFDSTKDSGIRGKLQGVYAMSSDNFSNLDELVDNSGTYLLVIPTSALGAGAASETYTAIAILEE